MKRPDRTRFASSVYAMVRRIPRGSVATYGQVAALVGHPGAARAVGTALSRLPRPLASIVPWQRVVTGGGISRRRDLDRALAQRDQLQEEGVEVRLSGRIDLERYQWHGLDTSGAQK